MDKLTLDDFPGLATIVSTLTGFSTSSLSTATAAISSSSSVRPSATKASLSTAVAECTAQVGPTSFHYPEWVTITIPVVGIMFQVGGMYGQAEGMERGKETDGATRP